MFYVSCIISWILCHYLANNHHALKHLWSPCYSDLPIVPTLPLLTWNNLGLRTKIQVRHGIKPLNMAHLQRWEGPYGFSVVFSCHKMNDFGGAEWEFLVLERGGGGSPVLDKWRKFDWRQRGKGIETLTWLSLMAWSFVNIDTSLSFIFFIFNGLRF